MTPFLLTQSSIKDFKNCRRLAKYKYEQQLWSIDEDTHALYFGSVMHDCLQAHHLGLSYAGVIAGKAQTPEDRATLNALMWGYSQRWPKEDFEVIALEKEFRLPLRDPDGVSAQSFVRAGKVDGIIRRADGVWLVEHKSASRIDAEYLSKLWMDLQITYYSAAVEEMLGEPVVGVLYNVIRKPSRAEMSLFVGETDAEWQDRYDAAKNKKLLKRKMSETIDDFRAKMVSLYAHADMFHREEIVLTADDMEEVLREAYSLARDWHNARTTGHWYRNTDHCYKWNRPCAYLPLCRSHENPLVLEANYTTKAPHRELDIKPKETP